MSADLVRVPWQPVYWLTPHTLKLLVAASRRLGYNGTTTGLMLYAGDQRGLLSAWRSYAMQLMLWLAALAGGTTASNPDTGQRSHMRGAAFDLVRVDSAAQAACRAVGLIRDPEEDWHWNDPNWASMPIIKTNTALAGGDATLLTTEEFFMPKVIKDTDATKASNRYAVTDLGFTFDFITGTDSQIAGRLDRKKKIIGQKESIPLDGAEFAVELADVNANRVQAGLPPIVRPT